LNSPLRAKWEYRFIKADYVLSVGRPDWITTACCNLPAPCAILLMAPKAEAVPDKLSFAPCGQNHLDVIMKNTVKHSPLRFYAMLMIGIGLISIGIMLSLFLKDDPSATAASTQDFSAVPVQVDFAAPKLDLTDLAGRSVSLNDYLGKVVLVNLWATWCPPCRQEMPTLQTFYEKYKQMDFVLIAIDQEETLDVVQPFVNEFGLTFPVWLDLQYLAEREFNTQNLPSSYVIDRNGRVRLTWIGGISKQNLEKFVPDLIKE
jgi:thiol-disulfide isomerase/thioredoxin